jgi:hypothetical protein
MRNGRIMDENSRLVEITGHGASEDDFLVCAALGRVAIRPRCNDWRVRSTDAGRRRGIQPLATGKSAEADSRRGLHEQEARLLKVNLKRTIRTPEDPLSDVWRKKNCWRDTDIRGGHAAAVQPNLRGKQS